MNINELKNKLKKFQNNEIIITSHARIQAIVRDIELEEVRKNISNTEKLVYMIQQETTRKNEEKYDCYFAYNKNLCLDIFLR